MLRGKKPKIGDIYEVAVLSGLAYFQCTHDSCVMGYLVRVLPGIYPNRPTAFALFALQKELYFIFLPLAQALHKREIKLISNQPIPDWVKPFPTMRKVAGRTRDGSVTGWYIGNGLRLYAVDEMKQALHVRELTPEQKKLSITQLWPVSTLASQIQRGWLPERNQELEEEDRKAGSKNRAEQDKAMAQSETRFIDHYLYFSKRDNAEKAASPLRSKGWIVEVKIGADGKNWLVLAKQPAPIKENIEEVRDELERLAKDFSGEYDGWGAAV